MVLGGHLKVCSFTVVHLAFAKKKKNFLSTFLMLRFPHLQGGGQWEAERYSWWNVLGPWCLHQDAWGLHPYAEVFFSTSNLLCATVKHLTFVHFNVSYFICFTGKEETTSWSRFSIAMGNTVSQIPWLLTQWLSWSTTIGMNLSHSTTPNWMWNYCIPCPSTNR